MLVITKRVKLILKVLLHYRTSEEREGREGEGDVRRERGKVGRGKRKDEAAGLCVSISLLFPLGIMGVIQ